MSNNSTQMTSGKAFEYALLKEFEEKLGAITRVEVVKKSPFEVAKKCFDEFDNQQQGRYLLTASFAVNFLMDIEPRLSNSCSKDDILQLEILADSHGELGDVRDILVIRLLQKWEIGISAKNNHRAVKYSRLSKNIDFGEKWLGIKCSKEYFEDINKIFDPLEKIKVTSKSTQTWDTLKSKEDEVYIPILNAFAKELLRIND